MAEYTQQDIEAAVAGGLISEDDAAQLMGGQPAGGGASFGGVAGGLAGAALGGVAGAKLGGMGARKLAGMDPGTMQKAGGALTAPHNVPGMGQPHSAGAMGAGAMGAGAGGAAGAMGGDAASTLSEEDRAAATQALMDPNTPPDVKNQIMAILDADGGMPDATGAVAGGMLGGALGGVGGSKAMGKFMPDAGIPAGADMGRMASMGAGAKRLANSPMGTGAMGVMGAGGGAMLGDFAQAAGGQSPYQDPLAGQ